MKKVFFTIAMALMSFVGVNAQSLSVENVSAEAGETATAIIKFDAPVECKALQMTIACPEGIEIPYDAEEEEWGIAYGDLLPKKYSVDINKTDNNYKFLVYRNSADPKFNDKSGSLLEVQLKVADSASGELEVKIKDIVVNDLSSNPVEGFEDVAFKVTVGDATGINGISLDNPNAEVYNLNGQRVKNVTKGVYVVNGKKVAVK